MENINKLLERYLCDQVALEAQLCRVIEPQIADVSEADFPEAKSLLIKAKNVLAHHFRLLNGLLEHLDQAGAGAPTALFPCKTGGFADCDRNRENERVSKMLLEDFSALNLLAMESSVLYTTALALDRADVAAAALQHLQSLAPLVVKMGDLVPHVVARELVVQSAKIDPEVGQVAVRNVRLAWRAAN